jgi:serine/threonine-protein kinase
VTTIGTMAVPRPLAGRYAFARRIRGTQRTIIWIARDERTRSNVVASVLPGARAAGLARAVGMTHPNAAAILEIVERLEPEELPAEETPAPDSRVVIAEHMEGRSLQQRLEAGPIALENAVEWSAAVADALSALHTRGAVHGALSPRAILVVRPEPAVIPALTHLLVPPSGAYCSPERVTGAGPSESDDIWALAATLYTALARRPPFQGASRTELARSIVAAAPKALDDIDTDLWMIVARALAREPGERFESAAALRDALNGWTEMTGRHSIGDFAPVAAMVGFSEEPPNVGDLSLVAALARPDSAEAMAPLMHSLDPGGFRDAHSDPRELAPDPAAESAKTAPAQAASERSLPPTTGAATPVVAAPEPAKPRKTGSLVAGVAAAIVAAAGIGVFAGSLKQPEPAVEAKKAPQAEPPAAPSVEPAHAAPPASAAASAAAEAPATNTPLDANACAKATLPEGTLGSAPEIGFLCTEKDLWGMTRKVGLEVLKEGRGEGQTLWVHLGRYDLAAVATLRERCCPGAVPFTAATPKGICETLAESIHAVASDPAPVRLDRYAEDVECYVHHGVRYPAEWWDRLKPKEARGYFEQFLKELQAPR